MKITQIKISKLLSFGTPQVLKDLGDYNLLIGKNGSGKTNIFKILKEIPVKYEKYQHNTIQAFYPVLYKSDDYRNSETRVNVNLGQLEIKYEIDRDGYGLKEEIIEFVGRDHVLQYEKGDIDFLKDKINYIKSEMTTLEAQASFSALNEKKLIALLNVGVSYIFDKQIKFLGNGKFAQNRDPTSKNQLEYDIEKLPTGVLQFLKIFLRGFYNESILFLDEPELHLEPRSIRKLLHFFIWFISKNKREKSKRELLISQYLGKHIKKNKLSNVYQTEIVKQIFIASHSPIFINEFIELGMNACIYEFSLEKEFIENSKQSPGYEERKSFKQPLSQIRKIEKKYASILSALGTQGSDLLQTNGIIWVEGPSDIIYIQKWLEMYVSENGQPLFSKGTDYEFSMYGGALLDYLHCNEIRGGIEKNELVNILKINANNFLITDSDIENGSKKDKSNFIKSKTKIKNLLGDNNFWLDKDVKTIENYSLELAENTWKYNNRCAYSAKSDKVDRAHKRVKLWKDKEVELKDFHKNLEVRIKKLYKKIEEWNKL